ncbi:MAG TPA: hypothetical protein DEH78_10175, partial [Solibacterales bacterium]|nr:hypothetical protein [Bryobacterales bacterium]
QLDVAFGYASATGQLPGKRHNGEWRLFGIYYHDWRDVLKTDSRPPAVRSTDRANIRIGSFGGHYLHSAATGSGTVELLLWGLGQTGRWGRLDHRGASFAGEAGWQPAGLPRLKPWIRGGYHRSSGDGDPNDNQHGTFFQLLPTPRPFARFPFFDLVNNEDVFGALILRPHKALTLRGEVHGLRLSDRNDLWYLGGGAFQPWSFGYIGRPSSGRRGLATLYDVSADWNVSASTSVTLYYGHAAGRRVLESIYPESKNGNFGYVELTRRF